MYTSRSLVLGAAERRGEERITIYFHPQQPRQVKHSYYFFVMCFQHVIVCIAPVLSIRKDHGYLKWFHQLRKHLIKRPDQTKHAILQHQQLQDLSQSCQALTLVVQHGPGLEVELRRVGFGRGGSQRGGRVGQRIGGQLAGLTDGLCAAEHLLSLLLLLRDGLGARMGQLLVRWVGQLLWNRVGRLLRCRLGYGSCALQNRSKSCEGKKKHLKCSLTLFNTKYLMIHTWIHSMIYSSLGADM